MTSIRSQKKDFTKMSTEEMQQFVAENLQSLNFKHDMSEHTMNELKLTIGDSTATGKQALGIAKQLTPKRQELRAEIDHVKLRNAQLASDHNKLLEWLVRLESHSRRNNFIFEGVGESTPEDIIGKLLAIF